MNNERAASLRWAGSFLAVGFIGYAVAVLIYVTIYGQPEGTGATGEITLADRVSHLESKWPLARSMWLVETLATILVAIAGFTLQAQNRTCQSWLSRRLVWVTVGVGGVLLFSMYPLMLGGYPEAARMFPSEPGLFAVLNGIAIFIFQAGNAVLLLGLTGAFFLESEPIGSLRRGISLAGIIFSLAGAVGSIGLLFGLGAMNLLAPVALAAFLLAGYLGITIARTGKDPR